MIQLEKNALLNKINFITVNIQIFHLSNDSCEAIEHISRGVQDKLLCIEVQKIWKLRYKKFGNLCYVISALQPFIGHRNQDLRIKVNIFRDLESNSSTSKVYYFLIH
ncbi:Uncharacterized protein TCM_003217 [Theobroma cacao]|uniref:Uncharacterized protein n=1 Tax=Theobroma cacao TaxID=3641 RepID=A0A061DPS8_THECC|nr:Uncharacterized protein TCM_003217 [Theobroma cacao]